MTGAVEPGPSRAGLYAAIALAAALLVGGAAGYALARHGDARRTLPRMTLLGVTRETLLDSLGLAPAQRALIDSIVEDAARRAGSAIDSMMTEVRAATQAAQRDVRAALDDRQRARFDSIMRTAQPLRPRSPLPPRGTPRR